MSVKLTSGNAHSANNDEFQRRDSMRKMLGFGTELARNQAV